MVSIPVTTITPQDILRNARNLINNNGWGQHDYQQERGGQICYCASGAIRAALPQSSVQFSFALRELAYKLLAKAIEPELSTVPSERFTSPWERVVVRFNDDNFRTKEEVLEMFDKAINNEE